MSSPAAPARSKTVVVMPAYNAAQTLERTIADVPFACVDEIIVVDDASRDETVELARRLAASHPNLTSDPEEALGHPTKSAFSLIALPENRGYGGNQKQCYEAALARGADIVVMVHPDYQYDPKLIKHFVDFIAEGYYDVMLGSRFRSRKEALDGGMPKYKYLSNRFLTLLMNVATGRVLAEWHTGMRAYSREALARVPFHTFSDDFVFDSQMLLALDEAGCSIGDIPVPCRYFEEASSINFQRSLRYGALTVVATGQYVFRKYSQLVTYLFVGGGSFALNLATYALLLYGFHVWYEAAAVIAFCVGGVASFVFQKYATFKERTAGNIAWQLPLYLAVTGANLAVNAGILYALVEWLHVAKFLAAFCSNVAVALSSFVLYKKLVFRERAPIAAFSLQAVAVQE